MQSSQENACATVSFLTKLQASCLFFLKKRGSGAFFYRTAPVATSESTNILSWWRSTFYGRVKDDQGFLTELFLLISIAHDWNRVHFLKLVTTKKKPFYYQENSEKQEQHKNKKTVLTLRKITKSSLLFFIQTKKFLMIKNTTTANDS